MTTKLLPSSKFKPNQWPGGTTTELFIFPLTSNYHQRDFDFRLSTATVEVESSDFTPLHGVARTLMVLDGKMNLSHKGQHSSELDKFSVDRFDGGWETTSIGKCTDFNLMTIGQASGDQQGLDIQKGRQIDFPIQNSLSWLFLYIYTGELSIGINKEQYTIKKGDLLAIQHPILDSVQIQGVENSELVICNIDK